MNPDRPTPRPRSQSVRCTASPADAWLGPLSGQGAVINSPVTPRQGADPLAANTAAVRLCLNGPERGPVVLEKAERFRQALRSMGWSVPGSTQIVPVAVGGSGEAVRLAEGLQQRGFRVLPVREPTVPEGQARLRFSLSYAHTDGQLQGAAEALGELR